MLLNTRHPIKPSYMKGLRGLGVAPVVVAQTTAAAGAIAALIALVQKSMDDDWSAETVFQANMRKIHSAMLAMQCVVGGAQLGSPIKDTFGNTICEGGTKATCSLSTSQLGRWRALRDGFSRFWSDVQESYFGPSNAEAAQAKRFAQEFYDFYQLIHGSCERQGADLPEAPRPPPPQEDKSPAWIAYTAWGLGALAVIAIAVSAKSIFGKS